LQKQVEQILQLSIHDRGEIPLKLKEVDMHSIIKQIAERFNVNASKKGGMITTKLNAPHYHLEADKTHISNIIANLIDNALKYTNGQPEIEIITDENNEKFIMHISDNGIGISPENQKYIFNKLYRVPTGNLHDVKGFGLGLYYVKTMIEAHNGSVSVKSETNIGTTFSIELPLNKTNTQ